MNEQFPTAKIKEKIKALPPSAHDADLEMELRHNMSGKPRRVTTTLITPITPMEYIVSTGTEIDQHEI